MDSDEVKKLVGSGLSLREVLVFFGEPVVRRKKRVVRVSVEEFLNGVV